MTKHLDSLMATFPPSTLVYFLFFITHVNDVNKQLEGRSSTSTDESKYHIGSIRASSRSCLTYFIRIRSAAFDTNVVGMCGWRHLATNNSAVTHDIKRRRITARPVQINLLNTSYTLYPLAVRVNVVGGGPS